MQRVAGKLFIRTFSEKTLILSTKSLETSSAFKKGITSLNNVRTSLNDVTIRSFSVSKVGGLQNDEPQYRSVKFYLQEDGQKANLEKEDSSSIPASQYEEPKSKTPKEDFKRNVEAFEVLMALAKDPAGKERLELAIRKQKDADPVTVKMLQTYESRSIIYQNIGAILASLKSFNAILGSSKSGSLFAVQNLENVLMWRARNCTIRELSLLLSFCVKYRPDVLSEPQMAQTGITGSRTILYKEVVKSLERRWVEIVDGRTFVTVLHYPECFSEQYIVKLEDRMTELAETLPTSDLILILKDLAFKKRRSVPLLRALSYHLKNSKDDLDLKTIADCLFALKELSFKDVDLLDALCHAAVKKLDESHNVEKLNVVLRSILTCLGQIRYRPRKLLDKISSKMIEEESQLDNRDLLAFVVTTGTLNYAPLNSDKLYSLAIKRLTPDSVSSSETTKSELLWLDVVWSLSVLEKVQPDHLKSVLSAEFYNRLLYSHDHRNVGIILKLLNVNGVAQHLFKGKYNGPTIAVADDPLLRDVKLANKGGRSKLVSSVVETLEMFASPPNFLATEVNTLMGFHIDGEAIFGAKMKPLHLTEYDTFSSNLSPIVQSQNFKPLPKDATKVALLVIAYHDCMVDSNDLSGLTALCVRLLEANSYKTLLVRHDDLKPQHKTIERVKILEQKLKSLLALHDDSA